MITVEMEKQCGCFKRSEHQAVQTFENKDDALLAASAMCNDMNETFCEKHNFQVREEGNKLIIKVEMNG